VKTDSRRFELGLTLAALGVIVCVASILFAYLTKTGMDPSHYPLITFLAMVVLFITGASLMVFSGPRKRP
jgi:TRAP-type C4-dicarboxylate transport system permease large subunit